MPNDQDPTSENTNTESLNEPSVPANETPVTEPTAQPAATVITPDSNPAPTVTAPVDTAADQPVQPTEAPAPVVAASSSGGNKKKKLVMFGAIVAAVLVLAGASAGAYFGIYVPSRPDKIASDGLTNSLDQKKMESGKFEGEVTFSGGDVSKVLSGVTFEGSSSSSNKVFDLKLSLNTAVTKINLDARSTDGKSFYLRLSGLNGLDKLIASLGGGSDATSSALAAQYAPLISKVNNQWFVVDQSLLNQLGSSNPIASEESLSAEDTKKVGEIYKKHQFLQIDKKLPNQDIHGIASYHLQASINKAELKNFLNDVKAANIKSVALEQKDIDAIDKVDFSKYPFEMWVSKKDRIMTQLATSFEDQGTTYKVRIAIFDVNKQVNVEKPADAKSVLELLGEVSPLLGGGASAQDLGASEFNL